MTPRVPPSKVHGLTTAASEAAGAAASVGRGVDAMGAVVMRWREYWARCTHNGRIVHHPRAPAHRIGVHMGTSGNHNDHPRPTRI